MSDIDVQVQRSFDRDALRDAVVHLGETMDGTINNDPADNPDAEAAVLVLADLLVNVDNRIAAEGVQSALSELLLRWVMRG